MKKVLALVACCTVLASTPFALAQTQGNPTPQPQSDPQPIAQPASCTPLKSLLNWHNWRERNPARGVNVCQAPNEKRLWTWWRLYRRYREVTPYRCQSGKYGTWAIPCAIISCESHYSWSAYNPSGARGPYQMLGWPVPWPVRSFGDRVRHHEEAAQIYAGGSGRSNWVC